MDNSSDALLVKVLEEITGRAQSQFAQLSSDHLWKTFRNALTVHLGDLSESLLEKIDRLLQEERDAYTLTTLDTLSHVEFGGKEKCKVTVWNGDITKLAIEAIMNAANSALLGCFVKNHPCIDNQIHFWAGPRLRQQCKEIMQQQGHQEETGKAKVTPGYNLPCGYVLHTVGPIAQYAGHEQPEALENSYKSVLDACVANGIKSIAFCCLSTGMFGYPNEPAAKVALKTVRKWLEDNPGKMEHVVFNTFKDVDHRIYSRLMPQYMTLEINDDFINGLPGNIRTTELDTTSKWLHEADALLICAGAGMSAKDGYNVYVSPEDFKKHYPYMLKYGLSTGYEAMGLFGNAQIPWEEKWRYQSQHMLNMRHTFPISDEYTALRNVIEEAGKDYFVMTTNVDACFERAGFDTNKIYTPQGEWTYYQCMTPCTRNSVWKSKDMLESVRKGEVKVPKCPNCGGTVFGNVRGGDWFIHKPYDAAQKRMLQFVEGLKAKNGKLLIIEIGAGYNTPTVSRFPMESIAIDLEAKLVRVNPQHAELPKELEGQSLSLPTTAAIATALSKRKVDKSTWQQAEKDALESNISCTSQHVAQFFHHHGHYDWRTFIGNLDR